MLEEKNALTHGARNEPVHNFVFDGEMTAKRSPLM